MATDTTPSTLVVALAVVVTIGLLAGCCIGAAIVGLLR